MLQRYGQSRELVLKSADWVIPGHGKMFKVMQGWCRVQPLQDREWSIWIYLTIYSLLFSLDRPLALVEVCKGLTLTFVLGPRVLYTTWMFEREKRRLVLAERLAQSLRKQGRDDEVLLLRQRINQKERRTVDRNFFACFTGGVLGISMHSSMSPERFIPMGIALAVVAAFAFGTNILADRNLQKALDSFSQSKSIS